MGAGAGRSAGFNPGPTIGGFYQKWERRHNDQAMVRVVKGERPFYGRAQRSEMYGSNAIGARRAQQDRLRGIPSYVSGPRKFPTAGRSRTAGRFARRARSFGRKGSRAGSRRPSYGRRFSKFRRRFSKKRVAFSSALRHILCRPNLMNDIETWVQGWAGSHSAYQSWYALRIFPPELISQMFQAATRTAINSNTAVALAIEWYMKWCKVQVSLQNQCFSRTKVTMYTCYPRRDIASTVYDTVDAKSAPEIAAIGAMKYTDAAPQNCLNVLGDFSAVTSTDEPTDSTALNRLWVAGESPFNSACFTRMYKVVKVQHVDLGPGEGCTVNFNIKGRVMSMARFLSYAATAIKTTNQYALEDYYQTIKGFPVVFFRAYGQITNDSGVARTDEFTTSGAADVGHIVHEISGKCQRKIEFYAPFQANTRATFITSNSLQAGTGPGLDTNITQGLQKMVFPTLTMNAGQDA